MSPTKVGFFTLLETVHLLLTADRQSRRVRVKQTAMMNQLIAVQRTTKNVTRNKMKKLLLTIGLAAACAAGIGAAPMGTAFTYQGKLSEGDRPAHGAYDLEFYLYDAPTGGNPVGAIVTLDEWGVSNGVFTVELDFGPGAFNGDARWLEISVKNTTNSANYATLAPRTPVTPAPYALLASNVSDGAITSAKLADGAVSGGKIANGSIGSAQLGNAVVQAQHLAAGAVQNINIAQGAVGAPQLAAGAVTGDKLAYGSAYQNLVNSGQSPVSAGGVILSQSANNEYLLASGYVKLGHVNLISEVWTNHAPAPVPPNLVDISLYAGPAVWTGSEVIVWGGGKNTGARYSPTNGTWQNISAVNAPAGRVGNTAVWTGTEMIVWGGKLDANTYAATGGRYNPATDTWTSLPTAGAPAAREMHTAVWTGTEMIIWGGRGPNIGTHNELNTGARYNPANNSWTTISTSGAPSARSGHTAVWTGNQMIIWGGGRDVTETNFYTDKWLQMRTEVNTYVDAESTGARYNPANNTWTALPASVNAPPRTDHVAVWTGSDMLVWGGDTQSIECENAVAPVSIPPYVYIPGTPGGCHVKLSPQSVGARYNPANNTWSTITSNVAPPLIGLSAIWTGSRMIVWGGNATNHASLYDPVANQWAASRTSGAPPARSGHSAVWTGTEMIVWGGGHILGGRYHPASDSWLSVTPTAENAARQGFAQIWTGTELLIFGGQDANGTFLQSGYRYNPAAKVWTNLPLEGAPSGRAACSAVWTGTEMIVWGGLNAYGDLRDGARYNPSLNTWTALSDQHKPAGRYGHQAVWTGTEMILWGGISSQAYARNGGRYNPAADTWGDVETNNAPVPRGGFSLVWTGTEMVLWGGEQLGLGMESGGRYNPLTDTWTPTSLTGAPPGRGGHSAFWTGQEILVWGGGGTFNLYPAAGGRYNPATDTWTPITTNGAPAPRRGQAAVWDGSRMIIWGGENAAGVTNNGAIYAPDQDTWKPIISNQIGVSFPSAVWTGTEMLMWGGRTGTGVLSYGARGYIPARSFYFYLRP